MNQDRNDQGSTKDSARGHLLGGTTLFGLAKGLITRKPKEHKLVGKRLQRPKRVERMANQVFESRGGGKLQKPDQRVIERITAEEPKVHYLRVADNPLFLESINRMESFDDYNSIVLVKLDAQIKEDFPNHIVSLRGIQAALNGSIEAQDIVVMDAVDVVRYGKEASTPGIKGVRVEGGFNTSSRDPITGYFPGIYVVKNKQFRRRLTATGRESEVFPAMMVYEQSKLNLKPNYYSEEGYRHIFEGDPYDSVLALYILDAPLFR